MIENLMSSFEVNKISTKFLFLKYVICKVEIYQFSYRI